MTQKILLLFLSLMISLSASAQVGINTTTPDPSAALDVTSTDKGLLIPRVTSTANVTAPTAGMMVYQTGGTSGFYFYEGQWTLVKSDNLGNHTATQNLAMGSNSITGANNITATGTATLGGNTYPTTTGTNGQVLTTDGAGALSWGSASGGGGATLQLLATKTSGTQILARANTSNTGDLVTFNNVVTTPTSGSYSTSTNAYTASVAGLYYIQASSRCEDNASATSTTNQYLYVDINGGSLSSVNNVLPVFIGSAPSNMPAGSKGRGYVGTMVYLNTNDVVTIKGLSASASVDGTALKTDGSTRFMVVKL